MKKLLYFLMTFFLAFYAYADDTDVPGMDPDATPVCGSYLYTIYDPNGASEDDRFSTVCQTLGASADIETDGSLKWENADALDASGDLVADIVDSAEIADDAVDTEHLADDAVDDDRVATGIDAVKLGDGSFDNTELQQVGAIGAATVSIAQWAGVGASSTYGIAIMALQDEAELQALITSPWADADVANTLIITAQAGSTWAVADSIATSSVFNSTTSLEETTAANDSGANIVGVYAGDMTNSASGTIQGVLDDFDDVIDALDAEGTDTRTRCYRMAPVLDSYDDESIFPNLEGATWTIINMWCDSDDAAMTFDFLIDDGTPLGVDIDGVVCNKTKDTSFSGAAGDQEVLDDETVDLSIINIVGSPTWATFCMTITKTD